ncbi:MAG: virulence factor SrfB [Planctomycetes bacterium]|nr:virulence factor SrfB [Planctomycetota bacterium]
MHVLFANTGVQVVCIPLRGGARFSTAQIGYGWQRCQCGSGQEEDDNVTGYPYIQWQIIQSGSTRLFLAVDTTCGDPDVGFFCDAGNLTKDFHVRLDGLLDLQRKVLKGVGSIEVCIRPATASAGDAKPVHMVIDFGNSRTGALLLELLGEMAQTPQMMPFELANRYHLDAWDETGEHIDTPSARWFSSKTYWCNTPYRPAIRQKKIEYRTVEQPEDAEAKKGWFARKNKKPRQLKVEVMVNPPLFDDLSMVRMGSEADDIAQVIRTEGDIRIGVSSPKRYLWADDSTWLQGANWHMADPGDREGTNEYAATLKGPFLKYVHEDDRDFLVGEDEPREGEFATDTPLMPRHAPRSMMTAALYELLCQAYAYCNSITYRNATGDAGRARELRTLTLTFPSGMIEPERERFRRQAQKAINIFSRTLGKTQSGKPDLTLSIDEASAVHLTYIWSELKMLGQNPRLWFSMLHQDRGEPKKKEAPAEEPEVAAPAARRRAGRAGLRRPGATKRRGATDPEEQLDDANEVRIACIDIGGGSTDLMIAKYNFISKVDDSILGEILHQDGINLAGDQLVKRLLETLILPSFADALGLEDEDIRFLFGPEVPRNREFRAQRINWINRLFVPLAQTYLSNAVDEVEGEPISHLDPKIVDPAVLESLENVFTKLHGPGYYTVQQELDLVYDKAEFEGVVHDVFDDLIYDFCERIDSYDVDVVLLAGQPSKLSYIQQLVRMYLPLSPTRIIPMFNHYAGNWYPYQDPRGHNPGVIVDPKSAVVVGAAIDFLARYGKLRQFKFEMKPRTRKNTYHWGVMTDATSGISQQKVLFSAAEEDAREEITEFATSSERVLIGRKLSGNEDAQASPVYLLKMDPGDRYGKTEVKIKIKRKPATPDHEEHLEIDSVEGVVAGEPAILGENVHFNWRTLADERYYLDTGGLDNIELDQYRQPAGA